MSTATTPNSPLEASINFFRNPQGLESFFTYFNIPAFAADRFSGRSAKEAFQLAKKADLIKAAAHVARALGTSRTSTVPYKMTHWSVVLDAEGKVVKDAANSHFPPAGAIKVTYTAPERPLDKLFERFHGPSVTVRTNQTTVVDSVQGKAFGQHWAHSVMRAMPATYGNS